MKKVDDRLFRGPRPESTKEMKEAGITRIVDLQSGFEELIRDSVYESERKFYHKDMVFYEMHWSNFFPPTHNEIGIFLLMFNETYWRKDLKTYVHCHSGVDRTGVAVLAYRLKYCGWTFDQAYQEFVQEGRHWWFFWWKPVLRKRFIGFK